MSWQSSYIVYNWEYHEGTIIIKLYVYEVMLLVIVRNYGCPLGHSYV